MSGAVTGAIAVSVRRARVRQPRRGLGAAGLLKGGGWGRDTSGRGLFVSRTVLRRGVFSGDAPVQLGNGSDNSTSCRSEVRSFTTAHHEHVLSFRGRFLRLYVIYKINLIHINVFTPAPADKY